MEAADFSGYATKAGLKCSDGRTITAEAFKHMDGMTVPLVWSHGHSSPDNILGHAVLEARADGMYAHGFFNDTKQGLVSRELVRHEDVKSLSIYANQLVEKLVKGSKQVLHGMICEVSLVLKGANPGALIDYIKLAHGDGEFETLEDEAIIHTGLDFESNVEAGENDEEFAHMEWPDDATIQDVYDSFDEMQKNVVHYMLGQVAEATQGGSAAQSDISTDEGTGSEETPATDGVLSHQEGSTVTNVFEQSDKTEDKRYVLTHEDKQGIFEAWKKTGSMKAAVEDFALAHGIDSIDTLFPDAKAVMDRPEFDKRRTEWVAGVINGTKHTPFSRIKSLSADLTLEQARAKGYVKGNLKKEEFFQVSKRVTTPTTIYKKQKLDRDDIVDITDFDVVAWLKFEMRLMLEEELARAVLIGDGREVDDDDHINATNIRPIATDDDLFAIPVYVNLDDSNSSILEFVNVMISQRRLYKGSGNPTLYTTELVLAQMLTLRDLDSRRLWRSLDELATELRVANIVPVEVMEDETDLLGIMVNLQDYTIGADKGGEVNMFDDFDIDYNQYKYLIETRVSGALTKIRSALVFRKTASTAVLTVPNAPTFVESTGVVTIVATTGIVYKNKATGATLSTGAQTAIAEGAYITVEASPTSSSYYIANGAEDQWTFVRDHA